MLLSLGCGGTQLYHSKSNVETTPDKLIIKDKYTGEALEFTRCTRDSYSATDHVPICPTSAEEFRTVKRTQITITDSVKDIGSVKCCREIDKDGSAYIRCRTFDGNDCPRTGDWYEK